MSTVTKQQKNVPKLRFPNFGEEWSKEKFQHLVKINQGLQIAVSERLTQHVDGSYFYITNEFLRAGSAKKYYIKNPPLSVTCTESDILMTRTGNTGIVVTGVAGAFHNNFFKIKYPADVLNKDFLVYYLRLPSTQRLILKLAGTSTIPDLNHSDFYRIEITRPDLGEQQKIADFLGSVDAWLNNLRQQKTALESYKRGMMQKLFTQQIRFKDDNGKDFPVWEKRPLGQVFTAIKGSGISKEQLDPNGVNDCILYGELFTTYNEVVSVVKSKTNIKQGTRSKVGDLLIPCSTTTTAIDLANLTALNKDNVLLGGDITVLRGKEATSNIFYAYYLSHFKRTELAKYGQGVTIIHIYYSHFKEMHIDVPALAEQQKIADFLTAIDKTITAKSEEIMKVEQWKMGLMQKMFV